jgi:hydrogenase nickel incorporation protein HypA/HybF
VLAVQQQPSSHICSVNENKFPIQIHALSFKLMHELSITENLLEIAIRHGETFNATHVTDLYLVLGSLSSIVDDSVQFYWDTISKGTICEGGTLHFTRLPTTLQCQSCDHIYTLSNELMPCPNCASNQVKITQGNEFFLDRIEISTD